MQSSRVADRQFSMYDDVLAQVRRGEQTAEQGAAELLAQLSQEERLGLLDGDQALWPGLAAFFIKGYNHRPLVAGAVERLGIPGIRFTDGPRGVVMGRSTCFPVTSSRGASWDIELEEEIGRAIGLEARAQGANLFGGVVADIAPSPQMGPRTGKLRRGPGPRGSDWGQRSQEAFATTSWPV